MKKIALSLILLYKKTEWFHLPIFRSLFLSDRVCRFSPTCSEYAYQAIDKYGVVRGIIIGIKRIIRCHPFAQGGVDELK